MSRTATTTRPTRALRPPLAGVALLITLLFALVPTAAAQDGWYTPLQAERGADSYALHCARCHGADTRGRGGYISLYAYPALSGASFFDRWAGETVHTFLEITRQTMPLDRPHTLEGEDVADIVAFILQENGFPHGPNELDHSDIGVLTGIVFDENLRVRRAQPRRIDDLATLRQAADEPEPSPQATPGRPEEEVDDQDDVTPTPSLYTTAQAREGETQYMLHCARCHGRGLQGDGVAPSLAGENFLARWDGSSVWTLYHVVRTLMPLDAQGELEDETYAAIVAYILQQNRFPEGDTPLPTGERTLQRKIIDPEESDFEPRRVHEDLREPFHEPDLDHPEPEERRRRT